jgi:hypothetical protein
MTSQYDRVRLRRTQELPATLSGRTGGGLAVIVLLALAVGGSVATHRQLGALLSQLDARALERAEQQLEAAIELQKTSLLSDVAVLSDDARVRTTMMTPEFNEATVRDVLEDLRASAHAKVMAVLDVRGRVKAVAGADSLRGMDLGSVPVVRQGVEQESANVWTLPDQLLIIGIAPLRSGDQVLALFMIGRELGSTALAPIQRSSGASAAVLIGGEVKGWSGDTEALAAAAPIAARLEPKRDHLVKGKRDYVARITPTGPSDGAGRVLWLLPRHDYGGRVFNLKILAWLPVFFVGLTLVVMGALSRRRTNGDLP